MLASITQRLPELRLYSIQVVALLMSAAMSTELHRYRRVEISPESFWVLDLVKLVIIHKLELCIFENTCSITVIQMGER